MKPIGRGTKGSVRAAKNRGRGDQLGRAGKLERLRHGGGPAEMAIADATALLPGSAMVMLCGPLPPMLLVPRALLGRARVNVCCCAG